MSTVALKTRVLVVDDAVVVRRLVADALATDPAIEIAGIAANGRIALQKIPQCRPDVVILDIEMPELDGLATLEAIRRTWPALPVIMFSALTERGARATFDALALGANDYVTKPAGAGSIGAGIARVREDLLPRVKALAGRDRSAAAAPMARPGPVATTVAETAPRQGPVEVVAIGSSTGGPNALAAVLPRLGGGWTVPVLIAQHMPPMFTRLLAERLDARSPLTVREGTDGAEVETGHAYVAPGNYHMTVRREMGRVLLRLDQGPPENSCRPAVDPLFRSVASVYGPAALGVVLTGMGSDGLTGAEHLRAAGSRLIVQDEASSVVWGMPGLVARAGLAEKIVPLDAVALELSRAVARSSGPTRS